MSTLYKIYLFLYPTYIHNGGLWDTQTGLLHFYVAPGQERYMPELGFATMMELFRTSLHPVRVF